MTEPVELRPDSPDDRTTHRVAIVVFATVDAVDQVDADNVVRQTLRRTILRSPERVNPGGVPAVIRRTPPHRDCHWDVTFGELVTLQTALGTYDGGYVRVRVTPTDRAFPYENWEDNL